MEPNNPVLKKLGFAADDRVVIIHADDIGMYPQTVGACADLLDFGLVTAASVMVPCPAYPAAADFCRTHPGVDVGVHLTVTAGDGEPTRGPVADPPPGSGLVTDAGHFHISNEAVWEKADPAAVGAEINAQIDRALADGIDVTHVDTHTGTVLDAGLIAHYVMAALTHRVPPMVVRYDEARFRQEFGADEVTAKAAVASIRQLEEAGVPLVDHVGMYPLYEEPDDPVAAAKAALAALPPGLTFYIIHPVKTTAGDPLLQTTQPARLANYTAFMSDDLKAFIAAEGFQLIGYRPLRDLMRG